MVLDDRRRKTHLGQHKRSVGWPAATVRITSINLER